MESLVGRERGERCVQTANMAPDWLGFVSSEWRRHGIFWKKRSKHGLVSQTVGFLFSLGLGQKSVILIIGA
jgi:hypothetical protein